MKTRDIIVHNDSSDNNENNYSIKYLFNVLNHFVVNIEIYRRI